MPCPARYRVEERAAAFARREGIRGGIFIGDGLDDLRAADRIEAKYLLAGWGY
jgi:phosphoglycolate phosphatase-like HAD superfamily hydrolase